jgi:hypothetical protein
MVQAGVSVRPVENANFPRLPPYPGAMGCRPPPEREGGVSRYGTVVRGAYKSCVFLRFAVIFFFFAGVEISGDFRSFEVFQEREVCQRAWKWRRCSGWGLL